MGKGGDQEVRALQLANCRVVGEEKGTLGEGEAGVARSACWVTAETKLYQVNIKRLSFREDFKADPFPLLSLSADFV